MLAVRESWHSQSGHVSINMCWPGLIIMLSQSLAIYWHCFAILDDGCISITDQIGITSTGFIDSVTLNKMYFRSLTPLAADHQKWWQIILRWLKCCFNDWYRYQGPCWVMRTFYIHIWSSWFKKCNYWTLCCCCNRLVLEAVDSMVELESNSLS